MSKDEAAQLASSASTQLEPDDVNSLVDASRGHPALLAVMLAAADAKLSPEPGEPSIVALTLLERLLQTLPSSVLPVLEMAALLGESPIWAIESLAGRDARPVLTRIVRELPLVQFTSMEQQGEIIVRVHDLVSECLAHRMRMRGVSLAQSQLENVLGYLGENKRWVKARTVCGLFGAGREAAGFVSRFGRQMLEDLRSEELLALISLADLQDIMGDARILLYWARSLYDTGNMEEAVAKLNATLTLAAHDAEYETVGLAAAQKVFILTDQSKAEEAVACAEKYLGEVANHVSPSTHCELLLAYAGALAMIRRRTDSDAALGLAEAIATAGDDRLGASIKRLRRFRILLDSLWTGDWAVLVRKLGPLLNDCPDSYMDRQILRGNLALGLVETGRLARCESLLDMVCKQGHALLDAAYLPTLALLQSARGDYENALSSFTAARAAAVECEDDADIQVSLLYQSIIENACGWADRALETAERSFEGLSHSDFFGYSDLAAIEIGAGLLALGDHTAARKWAGATSDPTAWTGVNQYHALSGAMVLAVADCRDGAIDVAVERIKPFVPYIKSDSANWRMAMYSRTYPELLGVLVLAVGAAQLPIHMLRMVLPENIERTLRLAKGLLPRQEWETLGRRGLGDEQFEAYLLRKGRPICRVHLFGGLEVLAGERPVQERDWKKRKARLLFAKLVVQRGVDLSRDVILDALWPDLPETNARNNFYVVWSTMKAALTAPGERDAACPYVESLRGRCRIVRDAVRSDIDQFEELDARAHKAESEGNLDDAINALQELMTVYRGDLLPGDIYDDWFAEAREEYRRRFLSAMMLGANLLLEADDPLEALVFVRRAIQVDRYREDLYQMALRCHVAAGQRGAAIETYIKCKTELAEMYGLDPSDETMRIYDEVLAMEEKPRYESYGLSRKSSRDSTDW